MVIAGKQSFIAKIAVYFCTDICHAYKLCGFKGRQIIDLQKLPTEFEKEIFEKKPFTVPLDLL